MSRRAVPAPVTHVYAGTWPDAELTADAPIEAHAAQRLARGVRDTQQDSEGLRTQARRLGVKPATLSRLLAGAIYIDTVSLARMERAAGRTLWPGWFDAGPEQHSTAE